MYRRKRFHGFYFDYYRPSNQQINSITGNQSGILVADLQDYLAADFNTTARQLVGEALLVGRFE